MIYAHTAAAVRILVASPVPEFSFLPTPYRGWTRAGERRVQDNLHAHTQNEPIKKKKTHFLERWYCGKKHKNVRVEMWFIVVCTLNMFFVLFLHVERVCKSFRKESLTRTSSSFAYCSACTFKSELMHVFNCQQNETFAVRFQLSVQ